MDWSMQTEIETTPSAWTLIFAASYPIMQFIFQVIFLGEGVSWEFSAGTTFVINLFDIDETFEWKVTKFI